MRGSREIQEVAEEMAPLNTSSPACDNLRQSSSVRSTGLCIVQEDGVVRPKRVSARLYQGQLMHKV